MVKPVRKWDRILVRVPDGMKDRLEDMAADNCLPLNGQLLLLFNSALAARETASEHTA